MIKFGLKLWSSNGHLFKEALDLYKEEKFDFIEMYYNTHEDLNYDGLELLNEIPIVIHNTNDHGFHEFKIGIKQLNIWKETKRLADYFDSPHIIVHPGRAENFEKFKNNLAKIDENRILIENMAGLDVYGNLTFGYSLEELKMIKETKEICFDLEKAIKSACYQKIDYKEFISECLSELKPFYFHISGGDINNPRDEHLNLQEANFDLRWIKRELDIISKNKDVFLVFEVPKNNSLENDIININFLREI